MGSATSSAAFDGKLVSSLLLDFLGSAQLQRTWVNAFVPFLDAIGPVDFAVISAGSYDVYSG